MKSKSMLTMLGAVTALCLCVGSLLAQDNGGGPGGPPPRDDGIGGPGGPPPRDDGGAPGDPPPRDGGMMGGPGNADSAGGSGGPSRNFDPAQFQQRLLDQIRQNLNITNNDEWAAIQPLIQKVMETRRDLGDGGMGGPPGSPRGRGLFGSQASGEQEALQKALTDGAPVAQFKDALAKCRATRKDKQAKLEAAQNNLKSVLSTKQEAQAVLLGLLP